MNRNGWSEEALREREERYRREEELAERVRLLALARDVGVALTQSNPLASILQSCAEALVRHLDAAFARIWLFDAEENLLKLRASAGMYTHLDGRHSCVPVGQLKIGLIAQERQPHLTNSVIGDPRVNDQEWALREGMVSFAGHPLIVEDRLLGVMALFARHPLTGTTFEALASIADQIALGIERKREEEQIQFQAHLLGAVEKAVIATDREGNIIYWNPFAERLYDWPAGEAVGRSLPVVILSRSRRRRAAGMMNCLQTGRSWTGELEIQRRNGTTFPAVVTSSPLRDPDGAVVGIVCVSADITERKRAEAEIQRQHRDLGVLYTITAAVNSSLSLPQVLATFTQLMEQELNVPGGAIFLRDEATGQLRLQDAWGLPAEILEALRSSPITDAHHKRTVRLKKPVLIPDFRDVTSFSAVGLGAARPEWQSGLSVPLRTKGRVVGAVTLFSRVPSIFSKERIFVFDALVQEVGVAIHNAQLFAEVGAGQKRLESLSRRLVQLQEDERRGIARELHDEVGQLLTGLKFHLEMARRSPADDVTKRLAEAMMLADELIARVRHLSLELRPVMLDDLGLLPALLWHFNRYMALTAVCVTFEHIGLDSRLPPAVETAAYRIVQEALTNVARHAGVAEVRVRLWASQATLAVQIEDQGIGFEPVAALNRGTSGGLTSMQERARLLGGRLVLESVPGAGTCLTATLPLGAPCEKDGRQKNDDARF